MVQLVGCGFGSVLLFKFISGPEVNKSVTIHPIAYNQNTFQKLLCLLAYGQPIL